MILVTGATGLVGSQILLDLHLAGKKVRALSRENSSRFYTDILFRHHHADPDTIEWIKGDVNDLYSLDDAMDGVSEVYHAAGLVSFQKTDYRRLMRVNIEGTANMVNMAMEKGVSKFCHISSVAALGRFNEGNEIKEENLWKTSAYNSSYAVSKYGAEREVWRASEEGLNVVIVNPSIILGYGKADGGSTGIFSQVLKGLKFYTEGVTGFVDVRDVSFMSISLMENSVFKKRFILNSENLSYRQVFNLIADEFGKQRPSIKVSRFMSELAWIYMGIASKISGNKALITKETARNSQNKWYYSNEKVKKELRTEFIPIPDSIKYHCRLYKENFK